MDNRRDIPQRYAALGLLVILALAAWIRFDDLGRYSFWTDELYHVIAAQSLIEAGEPVIPARGMYWRAFLATGLTAVSFMLFGESEWSARVPFALVTLVFLVVAYRILAARFTRLLALVTLVPLAFSPQMVQTGRECRMYGLLLLFYFLGVFLTFRALEAAPGRSRHRPKAVVVGLIWAALVFGLATWQQFLAMNFGLSLALYCLLMTGYLWKERGPSEALRSRYAVLLGLMLFGGISVCVVAPGIAARFIELARTPMVWDTRGHPAPFCVWFFQYYYPAMTFIYPIGAVILIRRWGRLGVFVICAFVPVLLTHMFFSARIAERYLVYILPFFFLTSACVIEALVWALIGWLRDLRASGMRGLAVAGMIAAAPAAWLFMHPWLSVSRELVRYGVGPDWKQLADEIHQACENGVVLSTWPREIMYYGGCFPDYFVTRKYEHFGNADHEVRIGDRSVSVRYLLDSDELLEAIHSPGPVYFVTTDWAHANDAFMDDAMREVIGENMVETASVASGQDRVVIYQRPPGVP